MTTLRDIIDSNYQGKLMPHIVCNDGTTLSVQTSHTHYCTPRTDHGPYSHVEVGYPSVRPTDSWEKYFDGKWQQLGLVGTVKRIVCDSKSIVYALKNKRWRYLRGLLSFVDNATDSVYGYVPVDLVQEFIDSHGGETSPDMTMGSPHPAKSAADTDNG